MLSGKIISVSKEKGFGFIKPESGEDLFFHHRSVDGEFDSLEEGEEVHYEVDQAAEKPRAKLVRPAYGGPRPNKQGAGTKKREERRSAFENAELGFVTKIRTRQRLGFISADSGGPEILFGLENVSGVKPFGELAIGDSVRFLRDEEDLEADPPLARAVQFTERRQQKSDLGMPNNPNARRKKPTWRR